MNVRRSWEVHCTSSGILIATHELGFVAPEQGVVFLPSCCATGHIEGQDRILAHLFRIGQYLVGQVPVLTKHLVIGFFGDWVATSPHNRGLIEAEDTFLVWIADGAYQSG